MNGTAELLQLAHLLRVGAEAAREIAMVRPRDADAIEHLADEAMAMADAVEAIVATPPGGSIAALPFSLPQP